MIISDWKDDISLDEILSKQNSDALQAFIKFLFSAHCADEIIYYYMLDSYEKFPTYEKFIYLKNNVVIMNGDINGMTSSSAMAAIVKKIKDADLNEELKTVIEIIPNSPAHRTHELPVTSTRGRSNALFQTIPDDRLIFDSAKNIVKTNLNRDNFPRFKSIVTPVQTTYTYRKNLFFKESHTSTTYQISEKEFKISNSEFLSISKKVTDLHKIKFTFPATLVNIKKSDFIIEESDMTNETW